MDPDLIKAAAGSPLGVLSLMVLVISSLALAFFKEADARIRLGVFILMFAGAASFAAVVMNRQAPPPPEPTAPTSMTPSSSGYPKADLPSSPVRPRPAECRLKGNGVEKWDKVERVDADSGWRGGGSSPAQYCDGELLSRRSLLADEGEIELVASSEDSRDENPPFNVRKYRYTCVLTQRTRPVYKLAASPECPNGG